MTVCFTLQSPGIYPSDKTMGLSAPYLHPHRMFLVCLDLSMRWGMWLNICECYRNMTKYRIIMRYFEMFLMIENHLLAP
jgi:hypothetical protein